LTVDGWWETPGAQAGDGLAHRLSATSGSLGDVQHRYERVGLHRGYPQPRGALHIGDRREDRVNERRGIPVEVQLTHTVAVAETGVIANGTQRVDLRLVGLTVQPDPELICRHSTPLFSVCSACSATNRTICLAWVPALRGVDHTANERPHKQRTSPQR